MPIIVPDDKVLYIGKRKFKPKENIPAYIEDKARANFEHIELPPEPETSESSESVPEE